MPKMSGLTLIERVRRRGKCTPIIMVSSDDSYADHALAAGANAFVRKGPLASHLAPALDQLLNHRPAGKLP